MAPELSLAPRGCLAPIFLAVAGVYFVELSNRANHGRLHLRMFYLDLEMELHHSCILDIREVLYLVQIISIS